jgi:SAM-dependent methyltransferase
MSVRFARHKPRHLGLSVAYKLKRLIPLDWWLDLEWIAWRMAHEKAGELIERPNNFLHSRIQPDHSVVDVGCNTGHIAAQIKAKRVVGVDYDRAAIERGRKLFPHVELVCAHAGAYLSAGHKFDVAILSHVLEHIDEPEELLSRLSTNLTYVEVPDFEASPLNAVRVKRGRRAYSDNDHVVEWDRNDLKALFSHCGFRVIDEEYAAGVMRFWLSRYQAVGAATGE